LIPTDLVDISSDSTTGATVSTPPGKVINTTTESQSPQSPTHVWPIFNKTDDTVLKGPSYFKAKKTNIVNLVRHTATAWKPIFSGLHMLSWEDEGEHNKPINIFVVSHFDRAKLVKPTTSLFDPAY